jgi:hypothetical protein
MIGTSNFSVEDSNFEEDLPFKDVGNVVKVDFIVVVVVG